ncbi:MAG: T9SS type A sorting domain-containing protein [Bacteroidota bacterium]
MQLKYSFLFLIVLLSTNWGKAQCWPEGFTHETNPQQQWLSCNKSQSPNAKRGSEIWLMYDFGFDYNLGTSIIWNYNEPNFTEYGIKKMAVDYSSDGVNWTSWGEHDLDLATGRRDDIGSVGPDLSGIKARYILLSVIETGESSVTCAGIAEVRFNLSDVTTSVEEVLTQTSLEVNPNPARDFVNIRVPGVRLQNLSLIDVQGRVVKALNPTNEFVRVDIGTLPYGIYLVRGIDNEGNLYQDKLTVQ